MTVVAQLKTTTRCAATTEGIDCCMCTCIARHGIACEFGAFECLDPTAGNEIHDCKVPPPDALPCPADAQRTWVVEDSAQARALAVAVNCSGGTFEVKWKGSVIVDQAIYVVGGTVLNITGVDSSAGIDGHLDTKLFIVVNASLHLRDMTISRGVGIAGGAIAASRSSLASIRTSFIGNNAAGSGGGTVCVQRRQGVFYW